MGKESLVPSNMFQQRIETKLPDVLSGLTCINKKPILFEPSLPLPLVPVNIYRPPESYQLAVEVNNVCKAVGDIRESQILNNFSMKVPTGAIYCLLGSSGCGKTTILSCIVGLKNWDSGSISVLGYKQGAFTKEYMEIGRQIGYMPQELTLYDHLTVKEIFQYYGKLYDLTDRETDVRWRTLAKLLELSSKRSMQIKGLSGGQKRRVSLAIALVHSPKLLILDEPTVGLDPLLRKRIWEHLHELIALKITVLITTHYMEEAKFSNVIGIMRTGRMLIEDSPQSLLSTYKTDLLQDSILKICKKDHETSRKAGINPESLSSATSNNKTKVVFQYRGRITLKASVVTPETQCKADKVAFCGFKGTDPEEIVCGSKASLKTNWKGNLQGLESDCHYYGSPRERLLNFVRKSVIRTVSFSSVMWIYLMRQPIFAFILLFLPAIQLILTFYVVGREPTSLKVGVINFEALSQSLHPDEDACHNVSFTERTCDIKLLSCHIQNKLFQNKKLNMIKIVRRDEADKILQEGAIFGYVVFPRNYSESLINRFMLGRLTSDNETLEESKLSITLDKSNYLAYHLILKEVFEALESMSKSLEMLCGLHQHAHEIPLHYREPVFGKLEGTYQESIIPAIVAQILFEIMYGIAPMILIKDLKQGTFARSNLAGLRFSEFMLGIFITMGPILLLQSISCYIVLHHGFAFKVKGSFWLFVLLCLVAGLCGQGFGIFMGILVKSEFAVIVSAIMVVPIIMTCSGTLWPLESHPGYLMVTYYIFPSALIVSSLRSVVNRGVGISHFLVWPGLANSLSWCVAFWLLSILGFRRIVRT